MNILKLGTAVLALGMLTACNGFGIKTGPGTSVLIVKPPKEIAQPVAVPQPEGRTNGDLAKWADELRAALEEANRRLKKLGEL